MPISKQKKESDFFGKSDFDVQLIEDEISLNHFGKKKIERTYVESGNKVEFIVTKEEYEDEAGSIH